MCASMSGQFVMQSLHIHLKLADFVEQKQKYRRTPTYENARRLEKLSSIRISPFVLLSDREIIVSGPITKELVQSSFIDAAGVIVRKHS